MANSIKNVKDDYKKNKSMERHTPSAYSCRTGNVKIALIGAPCSGKTSLYNILSENYEYEGLDSFIFSTTGDYE